MVFELIHSSFLFYTALFVIGFINALPVPITGTVLSVWLTEHGIEKNLIGFFSLMGIPFSLKIFWTPIIDYAPFSLFSTNRRKMWMIYSLFGISLSLLGMSFVDPVASIIPLSLCLLSLSLFSGCLYITGIAYELESLEPANYGIGSAYVTSGYRVGLLVGGGGALALSGLFGWSLTFQIMAALPVIGALIFIVRPEPHKSQLVIADRAREAARYPTLFHAFWRETLLRPIHAFFQLPHWKTIVLIILTYKIGDEMGKCMEGPFYLSLGFTKNDIAFASKTWGVMATIVGALFGGLLVKKREPIAIFLKLGFLHACSLICHCALALIGKSVSILIFTVSVENLTGGMAITAFISLLWKTCDKKYATVQYALFWSLLSFKADLFAFFSGEIAVLLDWTAFYGFVTSFAILTAALPWMIHHFFVKKMVVE